MLIKNYNSKKNLKYRHTTKNSIKKKKGGFREETNEENSLDEPKKTIDKIRSKEIDEFNKSISNSNFSQLELLIKLTLCIAIDLNQQFIFDFGEKLTDFLIRIDDMSQELNQKFPSELPFGTNTLSYKKIIENKQLCQNTGIAFNCFTKNQIGNLIKQILFFYLNFREFGVTDDKITKTFFSNTIDDISIAGKYFRAVIVILVYLDYHILELKRKKEFDKTKRRLIKASVDILLNIIFRNFIYQIKNIKDLYIFISEKSKIDSHFDFLFPINYSNYSIVFLLCQFPLINLINEKIISSNEHPIVKIFDPTIIERIFDTIKSKVDSGIERKGEPEINIDVEKKNYINLLLNPISKEELLYPIQCAIINCNLCACKVLIKYMSIHKYIQIHSKITKNLEMSVFRGYYHLGNFEDIQEGNIPFLESGMIHFNNNTNLQLAQIVMAQLSDNIQSVFSSNSIMLIKKFEVEGSEFDNDDSEGIPWHVNPHPSVASLVYDVIPEYLKQIDNIISLLQRSNIIEQPESNELLLNQQLYVDISNILNPGLNSSNILYPNNTNSDLSKLYVFNPVTGNLTSFPPSTSTTPLSKESKPTSTEKKGGKKKNKQINRYSNF